jgi:hypothetical protein
VFAFADLRTTNITSKWAAQLSVLAAVLVPFMIGCGAPEGPERIALSGTVKFDGNHLPAGVIRFLPAGGTQGPATSATIQNGRYEFTKKDGPILGAHRIEIEATEYLGFAMDDEAAFAANIQQNRRALPKNPVPDIYNRQSTLNADVAVEGPREFNFELTSATNKSRP